MKVAIGCDHAGIVLKEAIVKHLYDLGIEVEDLGTASTESVDYTIYGEKVARAVAQGESDKGILMCGTGIGISIVANKVKGIRCAVVHDEFTAEMSKAHNDANIIALGGRILTPSDAVNLVNIWLKTEFLSGKHSDRIANIHKIEKS